MNNGIIITMIVNTLIAIGMYLAYAKIRTRLSRLMVFFFIMTPTLAVISNELFVR